MNDTTNEKVKQLRESKKLTQSQMAEKMNISTNAYGRLERGETEMTERKLKQIAKVLEINDFTKILSTPYDKVLFLLNESNENSIIHSQYYNADLELKFENEKLALLLDEQKKLLAAKDEQIQLLKELVKSLQK